MEEEQLVAQDQRSTSKVFPLQNTGLPLFQDTDSNPGKFIER